MWQTLLDSLINLNTIAVIVIAAGLVCMNVGGLRTRLHKDITKLCNFIIKFIAKNKGGKQN